MAPSRSRSKRRRRAAATPHVLMVGHVELVLGGGIDGGDVFVGEGEDRLSEVAAARLHLLQEQEREGAPRRGQIC